MATNIPSLVQKILLHIFVSVNLNFSFIRWHKHWTSWLIAINQPFTDFYNAGFLKMEALRKKKKKKKLVVRIEHYSPSSDPHTRGIISNMAEQDASSKQSWRASRQLRMATAVFTFGPKTTKCSAILINICVDTSHINTEKLRCVKWRTWNTLCILYFTWLCLFNYAI